MGASLSNSLKICFVLILTSTFLMGCNGSSDGNDNQDPGNKPISANRLNWAAVPSDFNPDVEETEFHTDGFEKINVDAFGYRDDVEVVYSKDVAAGFGYLRLYTVFKGSASWGYIQPRPNGTTLDLKSNGSYDCSIKITNGNITALKGGCYVRLQLLLTVGSEIEVYNVGQLITKRFIPISTEDFLNQIDDASWSKDKFVVIENFLASYNGMKKNPSLTAEQLGDIVGEFYMKEEKMKALGRLQFIVVDRENLRKMIDNRFNYFDREGALHIVGL